MSHSGLFERAKNREGSSGGRVSRDVEAKCSALSKGTVKEGLSTATDATVGVLALYRYHQNDFRSQEVTHLSGKSLQPLSVCVPPGRYV
jgi:hypothetical protein